MYYKFTKTFIEKNNNKGIIASDHTFKAIQDLTIILIKSSMPENKEK